MILGVLLPTIPSWVCQPLYPVPVFCVSIVPHYDVTALICFCYIHCYIGVVFQELHCDFSRVTNWLVTINPALLIAIVPIFDLDIVTSLFIDVCCGGCAVIRVTYGHGGG